MPNRAGHLKLSSYKASRGPPAQAVRWRTVVLSERWCPVRL